MDIVEWKVQQSPAARTVDAWDLPAGHVVEHRVASFGGSSLVEDVEGLQGFEFLFLMDLVPTEQSRGGSFTLNSKKGAFTLLEFGLQCFKRAAWRKGIVQASLRTCWSKIFFTTLRCCFVLQMRPNLDLWDKDIQFFLKQLTSWGMDKFIFNILFDICLKFCHNQAYKSFGDDWNHCLITGHTDLGFWPLLSKF